MVNELKLAEEVLVANSDELELADGIFVNDNAAVIDVVGVAEVLGTTSSPKAVYIALKLEPREAYGSTSAPRKAYDCWLASAWTPELSYVVTRTATLTKASAATSGERVAVNTPPAHTPFRRTPTAVFWTLVPTVTPAPWLALVLTTAVLLVLRPTSNRTCVFTPHATRAFVSSYTVADAVMAPPTKKSTVSRLVTSVTARKRYALATAFSRYCASALVGHGGP